MHDTRNENFVVFGAASREDAVVLCTEYDVASGYLFPS